MKPIKNWENIKATSEFKTLPAGGYVCEIKQAAEVRNRNSAGTHLEISFDILEGEHKGFFAQDWKEQDREDKFWRGTINQNIPNEGSAKYEQQARFFKAFITAIEDSNGGYHWNWDESTLKGKKIGVLFGEREKRSQRGTVYVVTDARAVLPVERVRSGDFTIPERKCIDTASNSITPAFSGLSADDDDMPF